MSTPTPEGRAAQGPGRTGSNGHPAWAARSRGGRGAGRARSRPSEGDPESPPQRARTQGGLHAGAQPRETRPLREATPRPLLNPTRVLVPPLRREANQLASCWQASGRGPPPQAPPLPPLRLRRPPPAAQPPLPARARAGGSRAPVRQCEARGDWQLKRAEPPEASGPGLAVLASGRGAVGAAPVSGLPLLGAPGDVFQARECVPARCSRGPQGERPRPGRSEGRRARRETGGSGAGWGRRQGGRGPGGAPGVGGSSGRGTPGRGARPGVRPGPEALLGRPSRPVTRWGSCSLSSRPTLRFEDGCFLGTRAGRR